MGGFFGVAAKESCTFDLFFGTDYHSHLGTRRAGMAVFGENGFSKSIHNIEGTPFRTKFEHELGSLEGEMGTGCISDFEAQPILVRSHHGTFAITTVSKINNADKIVNTILQNNAHFFEMSNGEINPTELVAPGEKRKVCTFLWVYYGFPAATYEGVNVEQMRYNCGKLLARRDDVDADVVAGVPDSGVAHAIGYANESGIPYSRPFVKYTPTWPRSFMPTIQTKRDLIAHMKLLPVHDLIKDKKLLLIDDSIVRGTQLRETTEFLYESGAKEVHIRPACPPLLFGCKYLNFSRSRSEMELIGRRVIEELEGGEVTKEVLQEYADPDSEKYQQMVDGICKKLNFTSLRFHRLDDMLEAVGINPDHLCTYCWNSKE